MYAYFETKFREGFVQVVSVYSSTFSVVHCVKFVIIKNVSITSLIMLHIIA